MSTRSRGVVWFVVLAFGGAWLAWLVPAMLGVTFTEAAARIAIIPGASAPALSALVVRRWVTREGFADAGMRLHLAQWRHYGVALLLPVFCVFSIVVSARLFGIAEPSFSVAAGLAALSPGSSRIPDISISAFALVLLANSILLTPLLLGEEFGWRGYLQTRLFPESPLRGAAATGLIWGLWHVPINLMGYNFPESRAAGLVVFPITTILLSVVFGWLTQRTGSVWAACVAHASFNVFGGTLSLVLFPDPSTWLFTSIVGVLGWIPLGITCAILVGVAPREANILQTGEGVPPYRAQR